MLEYKFNITSRILDHSYATHKDEVEYLTYNLVKLAVDRDSMPDVFYRVASLYKKYKHKRHYNLLQWVSMGLMLFDKDKTTIESLESYVHNLYLPKSDMKVFNKVLEDFRNDGEVDPKLIDRAMVILLKRQGVLVDL